MWILGFLSRHWGITDILVQAAPVLSSYFPTAKLYLDVYPDREEPGFVLLALRIATNLRYPDSRKALKRFLIEWWIPKTDEKMAGNVAVGTEPI